MIVKIPLVLALCVCIKDVSSASFSKVFVQSGSSYPYTAPAEYLQLTAPPVSYSPQIARLAAAPVGPVISPNYVPCGTPCIYPSQAASIAPSANIVQYQAPSLPVVVAPPRSEASAYDYSYFVYDDVTGDHKTLRELSDGEVVRGGYSFLQPDGLIREVQYVADDVQGFKAVVTNYPPPLEAKQPVPAPCPEVKNEHLTDDPEKKEENEEVHGEPKAKEKPASEESEEASTEHSETPAEGLVDTHDEPTEGSPHEETSEELASEETPHEEAPPQELPHGEKKDESTEDSTLTHDAIEGSIESPENELEQSTAIAVKQIIDNSNILVPYNNIIKCVQAAINGAQGVSPYKPPPESPLTYIILNKPC